MITLYHGSNMAFSVPDLSAGRQGMDFGKGFYLTPNSGTAQKMAERGRGVKIEFVKECLRRAG